MAVTTGVNAHKKSLSIKKIFGRVGTTMSDNIWWGLSVSHRIGKHTWMRVSGPLLLMMLPIMLAVSLGYLAIWVEIILPINIIRYVVRRRKARVT